MCIGQAGPVKNDVAKFVVAVKKIGLSTFFCFWGPAPKPPGFTALWLNVSRVRGWRDTNRAAHVQHHSGARVASQHCPILRRGIFTVACD
jgi:hypothetical protein